MYNSDSLIHQTKYDQFYLQHDILSIPYKIEIEPLPWKGVENRHYADSQKSTKFFSCFRYHNVRHGKNKYLNCPFSDMTMFKMANNVYFSKFLFIISDMTMSMVLKRLGILKY